MHRSAEAYFIQTDPRSSHPSAGRRKIVHAPPEKKQIKGNEIIFLRISLLISFLV
jgi:hypothetical protein